MPRTAGQNVVVHIAGECVDGRRSDDVFDLRQRVGPGTAGELCPASQIDGDGRRRVRVGRSVGTGSAVSVSLPKPPLSVSSPVAAEERVVAAPPLSVSSPPRPLMVLARPSPVSVSLPARAGEVLETAERIRPRADRVLRDRGRETDGHAGRMRWRRTPYRHRRRELRLPERCCRRRPRVCRSDPNRSGFRSRQACRPGRRRLCPCLSRGLRSRRRPRPHRSRCPFQGRRSVRPRRQVLRGRCCRHCR